MKRLFFQILIFLLIIGPIFANSVSSKGLLSLSGRILLSVEENGEAWYVNPSDLKRYFLGRPADAFNILKKIGTGISNTDLEKIPTGIVKSDETDSDEDGLSDNLEIAIGTNPKNKDSDSDGYSDKSEIINSYNPNGNNKVNIDLVFTKKNLGKIFIQTEKNGEAWYIDPINQKKYYLSRPKIAFEIMRQFGLGITVKDLKEINIEEILKENVPQKESATIKDTPPKINKNGRNVINDTAEAIRDKNAEKAKSYFTPELEAGIKYFIENMPDDSILTLGNLMSGSTLYESDEKKLVYKNTVYFMEKTNDVYFTIEKQENGEWLITNL